MKVESSCILQNCKPLKNFLSHFAAMAVQSLNLIFAQKIFVTWPDGPKLGTPLALIDNYIMWKFQLSTSSRFGVIHKKVKTWTHLPKKKTLSKNKGTRSMCNVPNNSFIRHEFRSWNICTNVLYMFFPIA